MTIPMKAYWLGEDIEQLPREKLIEIIHYLAKQLEQERKAMQSVIDMDRLARRARL